MKPNNKNKTVLNSFKCNNCGAGLTDKEIAIHSCHQPPKESEYVCRCEPKENYHKSECPHFKPPKKEEEILKAFDKQDWLANDDTWDEDIKDFISNALKQVRADTLEEVVKGLEEMKWFQYDVIKPDVIDIINKLKNK